MIDMRAVQVANLEPIYIQQTTVNPHHQHTINIPPNSCYPYNTCPLNEDQFVNGDNSGLPQYKDLDDLPTYKAAVMNKY
jgi:hypothetical protein